MTSSSSSKVVFALLANLTFATAGCGVFGGEEPAAQAEATTPEGAAAGADAKGAGPKAPPVGGPADTSELTNAFGVFVAPNGNDAADGSLERPLATIQAGIELGKQVGKRVYVCTGTYHEALVLADSISVIGGLDCSGSDKRWRTGAARTRVESPTSPAIRANDIVTATRIEGLDIVAPNAIEPSSSSIGLLATHANALVVAASKITAGTAANGTDGTEGAQLVTSPNAVGGYSTNAGSCNDVGRCTYDQGWINNAVVAQGGTNQCDGQPGHIAESGGAGGEGGLWEVYQDVNFYFRLYREHTFYQATNGVKNRTGAAGADSPDAPNGTLLGAFTADGYVPANGAAGADGAPGKGGSGGDGRGPAPTINPNTMAASGVWRGFGGAGGGAGGCPGLAGTPGTGGGASIAALLIDSATTFDTSELTSARGGDAGRGTLGSMPTTGGAAGFLLTFAGNEFLVAKPGGRGGAAGVSGNGGSGPSAGIAHVGPAPTLAGKVLITTGNGGNGVAERSRTDGFGITKTIPATPAGVSTDILAL